MTAQDDKTISGVLVVKGCHATRFNRNPSRCGSVGNKFGSLLNAHVKKAGLNKLFNLNIVKTVGDKKQTTFHYTLPCEKANQKQVMESLKDTCKEKDLADTCTHENQPDEDDSSSESSEESTTKAAPAKVTQKQTAAPVTQKQTAAPATQKATRKSGKTLKPSKPANIDCDNNHKVTAADDKTISGVLVVKGCHATRFNRKPSRCGSVGNKFGSLLNAHVKKAGLNKLFNLNIVKTVGDKKQTTFHYTLPCEKAHQKQVIDSLKDTCKEKDLADTCTHENQPDDDDSSSESSEESTTKAGPGKVTQKQTAAPATQKVTRKSGKTLKPSKPANIDCDKDHKVTAADDKTISGVLVVKGCHATRFNRKPSRCGSVGNKFGSLLNAHVKKAGLNKLFNLNIVKTVGDKKQTTFHYTLPCEKATSKTSHRLIERYLQRKRFS